jgi:dipeptidyl aminopeptidase/acylaminoacyl peptidase
MKKDFRETPLYREAETFYRSVRQPGLGVISDAAEISANSMHAFFAGSLVDTLQGIPPTRICVTELATGNTRVLTAGPNVDRSPKVSPDGHQLAFLSDRVQIGDFQLYLHDLASGTTIATPSVQGWVEYLQWSPNGQSVLLGVAGHGADTAGGQGAVTSKQVAGSAPSWMPTVVASNEKFRWRQLFIYDVGVKRHRRVDCENSNVWEAAWCGDEYIAAIVSPGPGEGLWYSAHLCLIEIATGATREILNPTNQIGWPAASPSGEHIAVVEATCSDRWIVAGELRLIEAGSGRTVNVNTRGVDITHIEWRSNQKILLAGHRGFETVVGLYDVKRSSYAETWCSAELSTSGQYAAVSGINETGDCVLVGESFVMAPEIAVIRNGRYETVRSLDVGYQDQARAVKSVERVSWTAPDGLPVQGWLLLPQGDKPHPLIMHVHGGPVWNWHPTWLGRAVRAPILMLIQHGYAAFLPNPRGSSGRGQGFAQLVMGDVGGADTFDYLSGLDHLVESGIADFNRLGVTGGSYGGFMTAWLITQDARFAAAVPVAPVTNHVTAHLISNIPDYVRMSLADTYNNPGGKYFERSPIMHAQKVKTPTLSVCGALDRCTPPEEATQFHSALLEHGVESVLLTYPEEGHGIRNWPATIDYMARLVGWFEEHMPASAE